LSQSSPQPSVSIHQALSSSKLEEIVPSRVVATPAHSTIESPVRNSQQRSLMLSSCSSSPQQSEKMSIVMSNSPLGSPKPRDSSIHSTTVVDSPTQSTNSPIRDSPKQFAPPVVSHKPNLTLQLMKPKVQEVKSYPNYEYIYNTNSASVKNAENMFVQPNYQPSVHPEKGHMEKKHMNISTPTKSPGLPNRKPLATLNTNQNTHFVTSANQAKKTPINYNSNTLSELEGLLFEA